MISVCVRYAIYTDYVGARAIGFLICDSFPWPGRGDSEEEVRINIDTVRIERDK